MLGRKVGARAALWGAVAGTLPDLDVMVSPFVPQSMQLSIHRGITHSIPFAVLAGAGSGRLLRALNHRTGATWREWGLLAFLGFITHALLDCFTMYGTQLFSPFSSYPVALSSIFIIDPLYTAPVAAGLIAALLLRRTSARRRALNLIGLGLGSAYLLMGLVNQMQAKAAFAAALEDSRHPYSRLFATPTPFNNLLWMGLADGGDHLRIGLYSLFDPDDGIRFHRIEKNTALIAGLLDQEPVRKLLWFSRGYYTVSSEDGDLYFNDLRFGRSDSWLTSSGSYVFSFRLLRDPGDPGRIADFRRRSSGFSDRDQFLRLLWKRIWGKQRAERQAYWNRAPAPAARATRKFATDLPVGTELSRRWPQPGSGANTELTFRGTTD